MEESLFESGQALNLKECEVWNLVQDNLVAPVGYEEVPPLPKRRKERDHFVEDSPLVMRAVVVRNVVDLLTIQNLSH